MVSGPKIPERIARLNELAKNLWWSWHPEARDVFRALDYQLWRLSGHNPVRQLLQMDYEKLKAAAKDPAFLTLYDSVMATFDADMLVTKSWFSVTYPGQLSGPIAYFSAEFAIHSSLPIYAGGLGILAGDICKEANDLGLPFIGLGFMYPQGYFHQHISAEGWQEEIYQQLNFGETPINPCPWPEGCGPLIPVQIGDKTIYIGAWQVQLGRVKLYLMETNVEENSMLDRQLSARLYTADREQRIQQEIILGIGGVRLLRALGVEPSIWHANEGHTAFMMLERIREEVEDGASFIEATDRIKSNTVFTTHTPVPAGHDVFPIELIDKYFHDYWGSLGTDRETFLRLGQHDGSDTQAFNMTVLALKLADQRTAVSQLHGTVTRKMWHVLWPNVKEEEVPITHITNGVHVLTWIAPEMSRLYIEYLGRNIAQEYDDPSLLQPVRDIPDDELWEVRRTLKRKLIEIILERAQERWASKEANAQQILAMGALLDSDPLTIGFVRRFTEYKRPALIFRDIERLKRIVKDNWRPVQIIFAGKSHPADFPSKYLLQQVFSLATDRDFQGRIAFIEDYDMHMARYLVQGIDLWLNTPRRLQEACGTSGMKAAINGALNFSVRDGWWHEGYNGANGWAIGEEQAPADPEAEDRTDAEAIYNLLEKQIVPLYYERDGKGIPHGWIRMVKEAIGSIVPYFSARRTLKEYIDQMYMPAAKSSIASRVPKSQRKSNNVNQV
jgi:starch phosphorylase